NFGDVLIGENSITLVERVQKPNGQRLTAINSVPESDRVLVYQIGNGIEFHVEPITIKQEPTSCWWMGSGIYHLHQDRVWRSDHCMLYAQPLDTHWFNSMEEISVLADQVENVQKALEIELKTIGLPLRPVYTGITLEQCQTLSQIADLWWLSWSWSEQRIKRILQKDLSVYVFNVSLPDLGFAEQAWSELHLSQIRK